MISRRGFESTALAEEEKDSLRGIYHTWQDTCGCKGQGNFENTHLYNGIPVKDLEMVAQVARQQAPTTYLSDVGVEEGRTVPLDARDFPKHFDAGTFIAYHELGLVLYLKIVPDWF